jgi:hypothetical protein
MNPPIQQLAGAQKVTEQSGPQTGSFGVDSWLGRTLIRDPKPTLQAAKKALHCWGAVYPLPIEIGSDGGQIIDLLVEAHP